MFTLLDGLRIAQRVYAQTKNAVTRRKFDKNVMIIPDNDYLGNRTK